MKNPSKWNHRDSVGFSAGFVSVEREKVLVWLAPEELPDDFDKSKLIFVWSKFKFEENETNHPNTTLSKIFYDGEEIEIEVVGDTTTKEQYHFIVESNYEEGDDEVSFDYTGDEFTNWTK